jgi:hypothetical protein
MDRQTDRKKDRKKDKQRQMDKAFGGKGIFENKFRF